MPSTAGSTTRTGTATRPDRAGRAHRAGRVHRFSRAERLVHRATGLLMLACLVSAACLYIGPLAVAVGRRHLMVTVHEWSGIALPLPFLLGLASARFRADLRRLNRLAPYDRQWLRAARTRRHGPGERPAGKFNAGQKLYAGWLAGAVLVMMFTGLLMWFLGFLPAVSRTSAIFVHDVLAWALAAVLLGHLGKAFGDPEARLGMRTGWVSRVWADRHHAHWLAEEFGDRGPSEPGAPLEAVGDAGPEREVAGPGSGDVAPPSRVWP